MAKIDVAEDLVPIGEFKTHASQLLRKLHETGRPALLDLEDIADYITQDNPGAAADHVASHPRSGRAVPEVGGPRMREALVGAYRVIYRLEEKRLLVLTLLEGHRRLPVPSGG